MNESELPNAAPLNVVIVGRPNVGKSSLFNRLLGRKRSIVLDTPGVTRDRIVEPASWWIRGHEVKMNLIDTGGLGPGRFEEEIRNQVKTALEEASVVLFVMDIRAGLTTGDQEVFMELRKAGVEARLPIIGVLNKSDNETMDEEMNAFYELGVETLFPVSAEHALGIDDLKDMIIDAALPNLTVGDEEAAAEKLVRDDRGSDPAVFLEKTIEEIEKEDEERQFTKRPWAIAIVGQPNVGKSTLLNAICGEKRTIVSPIAGTTVDSIDTKITWHGQEFTLIDTAGIRRKNKTEQGIEVLSVIQTKKTLDRADLAFLVLDGEKGVYDQDEKIAGIIEEMGCSVIIVLNKWDTQADNSEFSQKLAEEEIRKKIRFLGYAPMVFTTAKDSVGLDRLFRMVQYVLEQRSVKLMTRDLTDFIRDEVAVHNPFNAKFYMVHQAGRHPPTFVAHVSDPKKVHFSLSRHLIKAIRKKWGFLGSPIRFHFLKAKNSAEKK